MQEFWQCLFGCVPLNVFHICQFLAKTSPKQNIALIVRGNHMWLDNAGVLNWEGRM